MKVLVIGAGVAGVAAATRLADEGHHVTLVEAPDLVDDDALDGARGPLVALGAERALGSLLARLAEAGSGAPLDTPHVRAGAATAPESRPASSVASSAVVVRRATLAVAAAARGGRRAVHALAATETRAPALLAAAVGWAAGLARFGGLSLLERAAALRLVATVASRGRLAPAPVDGETAVRWLARCGQSPGARAALWEPLARLLLHDDPALTDAGRLRAVLAAVLGDVEGAGALVVDGPTLASAARRRLEARGAVVRRDVVVTAIRARRAGEDRLVLDGVELTPVETDGADAAQPATGGGSAASAGEGIDHRRARAAHVHDQDAVIAAIAPDRLLRLLPDVARRDTGFATTAAVTFTATVTVRLPLLRAAGAHAASAGGAARAPSVTLLAGGAFDTVVLDGDAAWLTAHAAASLAARDDADLVRLADDELRAVAGDLALARDAAPSVWRGRASVARPGRAAPRPRTVIEGLFVAGPWVASVRALRLDAAAASADEAATLSLEYEPPPSAAGAQGIIPVSKLVRHRGTA